MAELVEGGDDAVDVVGVGLYRLVIENPDRTGHPQGHDALAAGAMGMSG